MNTSDTQLLKLLADMVADRLRERGPASKERGYGPCDIISVTAAVRLLAFTDCDARRWLRENGLVHFVYGRPRVVVGDIISAMRDDQPTESRASHPSLRRVDL